MADSDFLTLLDPHAPNEAFPPTELAWQIPNGLLAMGGDLSPQRLINAYQAGIFPWFNQGEPIYWWSPDPRAVLYPEKIRISRSLRKSIRNKGYLMSFDQDFTAVLNACAAPRSTQDGTWITTDMARAYQRLHTLGMAHSVEVRNGKGQLVGGLYGIASHGVFSGESMFSRERDVSKIALITLAYHLQQWGFSLIDCQIESRHLSSMGAENIARTEYIKTLRRSHSITANWQLDQTIDLSRWQP
jgi:leucyl/phenylalanyl-tRNA--protein transferase